MYSAGAVELQRTIWRRGARIIDNYVNLTGLNITEWSRIPQPDGLYRIPSSRFLRPWSTGLRALEPPRLQRILKPLDEAARRNCIFHLNWHPHNFGVNVDENLAVLRSIVEHFRQCRERYGMRSHSMEEIAAVLNCAPAPIAA
jgi:hypothetical protein